MKCNVNLTGWALVLLTVAVAVAASCEAIRPAGGMTPAQGRIESLARVAQVDFAGWCAEVLPLEL